MIRDVTIEPFDGEYELVIANDNSGGIGEKEHDHVFVPYETVSYFAFRVAFMECVAAGGVPFAITMQNFNGDKAWSSLTTGLQKGMNEAGCDDLSMAGSTESNFPLMQSALAVTVLGKRKCGWYDPAMVDPDCAVAVIGQPLVGKDVITCSNEVASLHLFQSFCQHPSVQLVMPVGSKGIQHELKQLFMVDKFEQIQTDVDINQSSGPATCFIAVFNKSAERELVQLSKGLFHNVFI